MAKLDLTKIEGYADMTPEQKVAALEAYEVADPDYTGYVTKDTFDKTSRDLAEAKRKLKDQMSEDERAKQERDEQFATLQANYDKLVHDNLVSSYQAQYLAMGYDEKLAAETANAMASGDTDKVFANQKKHIAEIQKAARADALRNTPGPTADRGSQTISLDALRKMSSAERYQYSVNHPEEYRQAYATEKGNAPAAEAS